MTLFCVCYIGLVIWVDIVIIEQGFSKWYRCCNSCFFVSDDVWVQMMRNAQKLCLVYNVGKSYASKSMTFVRCTVRNLLYWKDIMSLAILINSFGDILILSWHNFLMSDQGSHPNIYSGLHSISKYYIDSFNALYQLKTRFTKWSIQIWSIQRIISQKL